jgi:predicted dienelactone hydrolase
MNADPMLDFTLIRPSQLTGRHPVITLGNGTGASPQSYSRLLTLYASHGFIVIASNNPNVGMVTPTSVW